MPKVLNLLLVEDSDTDAALILRELRKQGYEPVFERVDNAESMQAALEKHSWDIVISDYVLPSFSGLDALKIVQNKYQHIPCIITSGRIDDETAVAAMKAGAKDYIMKDNLKRLGLVVERELYEAQMRRESHQMQEAIRQKEALMERRIMLSNEIMKLFWAVSSKKDYLEQSLDLIREWTKCECAGIRVVNEAERTIPYIVYRGFSEEFINLEGTLSLNTDICACVRIILRSPESQDFPAMTPSGSLYLCHSSDFASKLNSVEIARFRGNCIKSGFQTIVIIPIHHDRVVLGAIHLADKRISAISAGEIEILESAAALIGQGLYRFDIEEKIKASEKRLAEAQNIARLGNWEWNIPSNGLYWSDEIFRMFGLSPQEFGATYDAFLKFVHPEDRDLVQKSVEAALNSRRSYNINHRIMLKDGSLRYVHEQAEVDFDGNGKPVRMVGTVQDITDLKRIEEELRALSLRQVEVQENERRSIARELHDEIGQSLTALKMLLSQAGRLPPGESTACLNEAKTVVTGLMQQVREMSLNLRPSMLDDLGLLPTLLWHFERFTTQTGIHIKFEHEGLELDGKTLSPEVNTTAYRIIQEALTNIARYAGVDEAAVTIRFIDGLLIIQIEDQGRGFDFSELQANTSTGLSGMRERVRLLGGQLTLNSLPGRGTRILVELPVQKTTRMEEKGQSKK